MTSSKKHKTKKHSEASAVEHHESAVVESESAAPKKNIREKMIAQDEKKSAKTSSAGPTHVEELQVVDVDAGALSQDDSHLTSSVQNPNVDSSEEPTQLSFEDTNKDFQSDQQENEEKKKVHIQFLGSDLVRAQFPQPFDVAEKLATDWVNDGDFSEIPLGNPILSSLAAEGLRKAKDVERKVTSNPNFQLAKGILEAQLEEVLKKWKK